MSPRRSHRRARTGLAERAGRDAEPSNPRCRLQAATLKVIDDHTNIRSVPEFGFTLTEHDSDRLWIVIGSEHRTIELDDGVNFFEWASAGRDRDGVSRSTRRNSRRSDLRVRRPGPAQPNSLASTMFNTGTLGSRSWARATFEQCAERGGLGRREEADRWHLIDTLHHRLSGHRIPGDAFISQPGPGPSAPSRSSSPRAAPNACGRRAWCADPGDHRPSRHP